MKTFAKYAFPVAMLLAAAWLIWETYFDKEKDAPGGVTKTPHDTEIKVDDGSGGVLNPDDQRGGGPMPEV